MWKLLSKSTSHQLQMICAQTIIISHSFYLGIFPFFFTWVFFHFFFFVWQRLYFSNLVTCPRSLKKKLILCLINQILPKFIQFIVEIELATFNYPPIRLSLSLFPLQTGGSYQVYLPCKTIVQKGIRSNSVSTCPKIGTAVQVRSYTLLGEQKHG